MNKTAQQLVLDRLSNSGALAPSSLHPVSVRLDPETIAQYDVLARVLGYSGRSQLLRDILEESLEDYVIAALSALASDPAATAHLQEGLLEALRGSHSGNS